MVEVVAKSFASNMQSVLINAAQDILRRANALREDAKADGFYRIEFVRYADDNRSSGDANG